MGHRIAVIACALVLSACAAEGQPNDPTAWPAVHPTKRHPLAGFWKDRCEDEVGLSIAAATEDVYSVSFCGPGGCFQPGTYRPNSRIVGDPDYRVIDADTLDVSGHDGGFQRYRRCKVE